MDAIEKLNSVQFRDQILMRHLKHINPPVASLQFYFTKESSLTFRQRLSSGKQVFNLILQHISKIVLLVYAPHFLRKLHFDANQIFNKTNKITIAETVMPSRLHFTPISRQLSVMDQNNVMCLDLL